MKSSESFLTRRTILKASAALAATGALTSVFPAPGIAGAAAELTTLRSTSKSWLWAAEDYANSAGFFKKAGVNVTSNASNRGTNVAALQGGGVDIVLGDPEEVLHALGQGLKAKWFVSTVDRYASNIVLANSVLKEKGVAENSPVDQKIAALKGLKLGTTGAGAAPDALFRFLAVKGGLDPNTDFHLIPIQNGGAGMIAALKQKAIDGFCLSSPTSDIAIASADGGYLFQMATNPPPFLKQFQYIIGSSADDTIAKKRPALVAYTAGIAMALKSIQKDPGSFKDWARQWFADLDPKIFDATFAGNSHIYTADPTPLKSLYEQNVEFISTVDKTLGAPPVPPELTFEKVIDPTIARDALKGL